MEEEGILFEAVIGHEENLQQRTQKSASTYDLAKEHLPGGVPSGYFSRLPNPIYLSHGKGAKIWDVDGNEYSDFNLCFGSLLVGHCNPQIQAAIVSASESGILLSGPTELAGQVAKILAEDFLSKLTHWRFVNSGSEATRAAIQVARAVSGFDTIIKIECGYHGIRNLFF